MPVPGDGNTAQTDETIEITREQADALNAKGFTDEQILAMDKESLDQAMSAHEGDDILITEDLVSKYKLPKNLVGQSIEKIADGYSKTRSAYSKRENELLREIEQLKATKNENQATSVGDLLDLEPEEQVKAIQKIVDEQVKKGLAPLEEMQAKKHQDAFYETLQSMLPEGYDAEETLNNWRSTRNLSQKEIVAYMQTPGLLIDNIVLFAQMDDLNKVIKGKKGDDTAKHRKEDAQKLIDQIKNAKNEGSSYNIKKKGDEKLDWGAGSESTNDRLTRIYEKNAQRLGV